MNIGEEPIHIKCANKSDISRKVIMPGDPLRAKYVAENFLENARLVTSVRNMFGYTGMYKGEEITVMAHGMGMPSAGIYVFELCHHFNVEKIIRFGTCGVMDESVKVPEIILADSLYSESNFAVQYNGSTENLIKPSEKLNNNIKQSATELGQKLHVGTIMTCDVFGPYVDMDTIESRIPTHIKPIGEEMEGFGIVHIANSMGREAAIMATGVDSKFSDEILSIGDREKSLNDMIILALESIIK
ncbi:MAG: purine-nucleoside phosphorylase [bacterium]